MSETVTIGDIVLSGVTSLSDSGGWKTAEKRVEKGFDYESYVAPERIEESIEAWVKKEDVGDLRELRQQSEPFAASVGSLSFARASLKNLEITDEGRPNHVKATLTIRQISEAEVESAEINIETESGSMGTAAAETEPSTAQPQDSDGGSVEDETGGIVGTLSGIRKSLSGVL